MEREIISRTLAGWAAEIQKRQPLVAYNDVVVLSARAYCDPKRVSAGASFHGLITSFWQRKGGKLPSAGFSITRFSTEADAAVAFAAKAEALAAQCPPTGCDPTLFNRNTFNNCLAFERPPRYASEDSLTWQVHRWVFGVDNFDDGSSYLEGLGLGTHDIAQRLYEAGAELGLVCTPPATPTPTATPGGVPRPFTLIVSADPPYGGIVAEASWISTLPDGRRVPISATPPAVRTMPEPRESVWAEGDEVRIVALVNEAEGFEFAGWSGDCAGKERVCVLVMESNKEAVAHFNRIR
jgi:hypothetical protein